MRTRPDCFGHRRCPAYQGIHVAETVAVPARLRLAFYQRLEGDERQHGAYGCGSQLRLDAETDKRRGESQCASAHKAECSESVCKEFDNHKNGCGNQPQQPI